MATLFESITTDPSTLAANMVAHAHRSVIAWAARRGIKAEFSNEDFLFDFGRMEEALRGDVSVNGVILISSSNFNNEGAG